MMHGQKNIKLYTILAEHFVVLLSTSRILGQYVRLCHAHLLRLSHYHYWDTDGVVNKSQIKIKNTQKSLFTDMQY